MRTVYTIMADEVRVGMLVQIPEYRLAAPDRWDAITSWHHDVEKGRVRITAGGKSWSVFSTEYVEVQRA